MKSKYDDDYIDLLTHFIEGIFAELDHMRKDIERATKMEQESHSIITSALNSLDSLKESTTTLLLDVYREGTREKK